jgi:carbonic anhydrase
MNQVQIRPRADFADAKGNEVPMRPLPLLLTLALSGALATAEDPKAALAKPKEAAERKEPEKAKVEEPAKVAATAAAPAKPDPEKSRQAKRLRDLEARLKRVEGENARLRNELAEKVDAGPGAGVPDMASAEGALAELKAGNARFVVGARIRTTQAGNDLALRQALAKGQAPFAVIVTCSDSRLADNFIFDQELGRLFTIREAGNCPDLQGLASIEYAVEHLGAKVVVVMGHSGCGAVKAVQESGQKSLPGNLWSLQAAMAGLLESVRHDPNENPIEHLGHLVESNAKRQAQTILDRSAIVKHLVDTGKVKVVPAVYDLSSGKVAFLPMATTKTEHH